MVRLSRVSVVHLTLVVFALALVAQAAKVQLVQGKEWADRARRQQYRTGITAAPRGRILDASGQILAESRDMLRLSVAPREVKNAPALSRAMREAGLGADWIRAAADRKRAWVPLPGLYLPAEITALTSLDGVHSAPFRTREYATAPGIRRIVGALDRDGRAATGIELSLDSILSGDSARAASARDVKGRRLDAPDTWSAPPRAGNNVTLTINRDLQEICERALAKATDSLNASGGDIVVLNPLTAEILAMASIRRGKRALSNTAVTEPFEPGSTLKPFIAAALVEQRKARKDEFVDTYGGEMVLGKRRITDLHRAKRLSLADVIRFSSNIGIIQFGSRLSAREKFETLRDLGFGTATGVPVPGESDGTLREPRRWSGTSAESIVMGYEITVTPLQLAVAYASLVNGQLMQPHIVKEIRGPGGDLLYQAKPRVVRRVFSEPVVREIRQLLIAVVDSGTAMKADLATFQMAGKSGTARRTAQGQGYVAGNYTASFVGLFPADKPQYVVLVKLDSPRGAYFGGEIAAPVSSVVLRAALAARNAALDRADLAMVERDVPLESRPDSAVALEVNAQAVAVLDSGVGRRSAAILGAPEPGPSAERMPQAPKLIALPFVKPRTSEDKSLRAVPDVAGMPVRSAVRALHRAGFRVLLVRARGATTIPAPGTLLAGGSVVKLQHIP